tara:strand:+ start:254 stop:523 length:270 start_codon:yes stop_codon:yes gene_type:complete
LSDDNNVIFPFFIDLNVDSPVFVQSSAPRESIINNKKIIKDLNKLNTEFCMFLLVKIIGDIPRKVIIKDTMERIINPKVTPWGENPIFT